MAPVHVKDGMAAAKRLGNLLDFLKLDKTVVNLYQSKSNLLYEATGVEFASYKSGFAELRFLYQAKKRYSAPRCIYYYYGYPSLKNIISLILIKLFGYDIFFDIVEDYRAILPYKKGVLKRFNLLMSIWLLKKSYLIASGYIGISSHLCLMLNQLFKGKKQVLYLPISINPHNFPVSIQSKARDKLSFFYGGSYAPKDDFDVMLQSFINAYKQCPGKILGFNLAGKCSSSKMAEINDIVKAGDIKCINFLGFLTDEEYYEQIRNTDILVMPRNNSDFANTGFPFKLGEYMATGNCVISARLTPIVETIGKDAVIYYEPESMESLTGAFMQVLNQPELLRQHGENSRAVAFEKFNAKQHVAALEIFFKNN